MRAIQWLGRSRLCDTEEGHACTLATTEPAVSTGSVNSCWLGCKTPHSAEECLAEHHKPISAPGARLSIPMHAPGYARTEVGERVAAVVREYVAAAHGSELALLSEQQPLMEAGLDSLDLLKACAGLPFLALVQAHVQRTFAIA